MILAILKMKPIIVSIKLKSANQGIASVAAMSNLPFNDAATFSTAMGIGNYRNATAFAWGMQYRINENVKVKASTAWNDANNWVSAGGSVLVGNINL